MAALELESATGRVNGSAQTTLKFEVTVASATSGMHQGQPPAAAEVPERPVLAPAVKLLGEMQDTGFTDPQWLIQRGDRFLQVSELLYRVAEAANGERTLEEMAAAVTESTDWMVSTENVRQIVQTKLIPMGLVLDANGSVAVDTGASRRSPLQIGMRTRVLSPGIIDPITRLLQFLYAPPIAIPLLLLIVIAHGWLYFVRGVADGVRTALYMPGGLLLVLGFAIASGIFHEFGHAAALRYGGGRVRGMGIGFYLGLPTFYSDTTDAYRLGRWARLRTDLGGIYFHLIFGLGLMVLYFITKQEVLLAIVLVISMDILYQLIPYVRLDGYWALADLTGIPDFFSQMRPFLRSVIPTASAKRNKLPELKPWARTAFATYLIFTIPVLALLAVLVLLGFPRFITLGSESLVYQIRLVSLAHSTNDSVLMAAVIAQVLLLSLSLLAAGYLLYSLVRKPAEALWNWSKGTPARRLIGALISISVLVVVTALWVPQLSAVRQYLPPGVETFKVKTRLHVLTPVLYPQSPPVGGNHSPIWQNCGFYDAPIANENGVHSLEHGAVWITYRPDLSRMQIQSLRRLARSRSYVLVSPYPALPAPVIASAWGRQVRLHSAEDPLLGYFVRAFRLGLNAPETGGPCTKGIGRPK
jgi:putative peptide zinc metalloprotease protein